MSEHAAARLRTALDMFEVGLEMQRSRLRREHPDASDEDLVSMVNDWLLTRPGATHGDAVGRPGNRFS